MNKVIICDDDEQIVSQLSRMIEKLFPGKFQVNGYVSFRQLIYEIEDGFIESSDLLFLDLEMKEKNGTEAAKFLQQKMPEAKIIFTTSYPGRSEEIFDEIYPFGLLLKPLNEERLEKYIRKGLKEAEKEGMFVKIKKNGRQYHIPVDDIFYVESNGRKLLIHNRKEIECVYERISNFCMIYQKNFIRCHQSYAVNRKQIAEISVSEAVLKNGTSIPISRKKYREVREQIFPVQN